MKYFQLIGMLFCTTITLQAYAQDKTDGLPITVKVNTTVNYADGSVELMGTTYSINNEPAQIFIEIITPKGATQTLSGRADKTSGEYIFKYKPIDLGTYKVIAYAADKKQTANTTFTVTAEINTDEKITLLDKALDNTFSKIETMLEAALNSDVSAADKANTKSNIQKVKTNIKQYKDASKQLNDAVKDAATLAKKYPALNSIIAAPLGKLSSLMEEKSNELLQIEKNLGAKKEKEPNICNTAYVISESCALLSTVMNVASTSIISIVDNIMIDKLWPKANEKMAKDAHFKETDKYLLDQSGKAFLTAKGTLSNLKTKSYGIGFAGDLTQHITNELIRVYCAVYKGPISGDYTLEFKNNGKMYMRYKLIYSGKISVYCTKKALANGSPKLSGYLEGNVTKMDFTDDVWAIEDKSSWDVIKYQRIPAIVPPVTLADKDPGFGAVARSAVPGSFYFPLQAQITKGKMVIRLMPALAEFNEALVNRSIVVVQQKNNALSLQAAMFSYPLTTANFILTRTMRMPEAAPTVTLDMITNNGISKIEKTFSRTETPNDTKVDFNLTLKLSNEKD
ncbi:hypothetical protein ACFOWM_07240 [Ferruginibacter yonginensis]|uniref:Uncharacterized protein n=1 Tax=Ferruginibacter yonginensis TaxID=1310416 RepID=A0ABV8QUR9_9BACT